MPAAALRAHAGTWVISIVIVAIGLLLIRSTAWGIPLSEPWNLVGMIGLLVIAITMLVAAIRRHRVGSSWKATMTVALFAVGLLAAVHVSDSSKSALRWHVASTEGELDTAAINLLDRAPSDIQAEARDKGWSTHHLDTNVPAQVGGFDFKDVSITSDGSTTWVDVIVGYNSWGIGSIECRGLTYAPDDAPRAPNGFSKLGTDDWHPIALGQYEHIIGSWYWHEWICLSI